MVEVSPNPLTNPLIYERPSSFTRIRVSKILFICVRRIDTDRVVRPAISSDFIYGVRGSEFLEVPMSWGGVLTYMYGPVCGVLGVRDLWITIKVRLDSIRLRSVVGP